MKNAVREDNFNRLAKAIVQHYDVSYEDAVSKLESFQLQLVCDETIRGSVSLQAALLTSINAGRRAYLGGVSIVLPNNVESLLPWPGAETLNEIIAEFEDAEFVSSDTDREENCSTLFFGNTCKGYNGLRVLCDGWRGGVVPVEDDVEFISGSDFVLGGVLAGSLAVSQTFLEISGLDCLAGHRCTGLSVWKPDLNWLDEQSAGPFVTSFPEKLWVIGLGHLGQAYLWTLGLFGCFDTCASTILLQDFDSVTEANWMSGLLCEKSDFGRHKTRMCSEWLEKRGFRTTISERLYDKKTHRTSDEPYVALCGVDSVEPRRLLENAGFDFVVESGLGGSVQDFDRIVMHTFPNLSKPASKTWNDSEDKQQSPHKRIVELAESQPGCGILAETLASKAVSTAFVGGVAAALVVGELLKALHGGERINVMHAKLRDLESLQLRISNEPYSDEMAKNGTIEVECKKEIISG